MLETSDITLLRHEKQNKEATNQLKDRVQIDRTGSERHGKKKHDHPYRRIINNFFKCHMTSESMRFRFV